VLTIPHPGRGGLSLFPDNRPLATDTFLPSPGAASFLIWEFLRKFPKNFLLFHSAILQGNYVEVTLRATLCDFAAYQLAVWQA